MPSMIHQLFWLLSVALDIIVHSVLEAPTLLTAKTVFLHLQPIWYYLSLLFWILCSFPRDSFLPNFPLVTLNPFAWFLTLKSPDPNTFFELFVSNCLPELYIQLWGIILVLYLQYSLLLTELTKTPFPWTKSLLLYFLLHQRAAIYSRWCFQYFPQRYVGI